MPKGKPRILVLLIIPSIPHKHSLRTSHIPKRGTRVLYGCLYPCIIFGYGERDGHLAAGVDLTEEEALDGKKENLV